MKWLYEIETYCGRCHQAATDVSSSVVTRTYHDWPDGAILAVDTTVPDGWVCDVCGDLTDAQVATHLSTAPHTPPT